MSVLGPALVVSGRFIAQRHHSECACQIRQVADVNPSFSAWFGVGSWSLGLRGSTVYKDLLSYSEIPLTAF